MHMISVHHVQAGHMPFLTHQPQALGCSVALPTLLLAAKPLALAHTMLARLLTVLAKICDVGTPRRKEPAGYTEAGPSGSLWGGLSGSPVPPVPKQHWAESWGWRNRKSRVCKVAQALPPAILCRHRDAVGGWGWEGR